MDLDLHPVIDIARPALTHWLAKYLRHRVRILVVVDEGIGLEPGPGAFGVERMITLMRGTTVGCMRFSVDIARRSPGAFVEEVAPVGTAPRYTGFRFDSQKPDGSLVIAGYDEVWCFGFKPHAAFVFPTDDVQIQQPASLPASDAELGALTQWMNNRGGLFGTGDHDFLGSPMCSRIPRLGSMRAWTNAQNVPPIGGPERLDTNRPFNAAEQAGTELMENAVERDRLPQTIDWVPWLSVRHPWGVRTSLRRPHPVLCHPRLGPIDVMPDHPHEGVVFDHVPQPDVGLAALDVTRSYAFPGAAGLEYPDVGGVRPLPMVIAHGRTLSNPPLQHAKGAIAAKRFGMISVYDGHRIGIGRVATDSTWHHWFNMNVSDIEANNPDAWAKISRYWINLAVWLAPPHKLRHCGHFHLLEAFYRYPGIEELGPRMPLLEAGRVVRESLLRIWGPCWVTQFTFDWIGELDVKLRERLLERFTQVPMWKQPFPPRPRPNLGPIDPEVIEMAMLGGIAMRLADALFEGDGSFEGSVKRLESLSPETLDQLALKGLAAGLESLQAVVKGAQAESRQILG